MPENGAKEVKNEKINIPISDLLSLYSILQNELVEAKNTIKFMISLLLPLVVSCVVVLLTIPTITNEMKIMFITVAIFSIVILIKYESEKLNYIKLIQGKINEVSNMLSKNGLDILDIGERSSDLYLDLLIITLVSTFIGTYLILAIIRYLLGV